MTRINAADPLSLKPGDQLPKQFPGGPPHLVTEVQPVPNSNLMRVVTNQGEWTVPWNHSLTFPRRPDGSVKNWFESGEIPSVRDLAVGDTLPPDDPDPFTDPTFAAFPEADRLRMHEQWKKSVQVVTAIWADKNSPQLVWRFNTIRMDNLERIPANGRGRAALVTQPLTFPWHEVDAPRITPMRRADTPVFEGYGPYLTPDKRIVFIAVHPSGRGRWPRIINSAEGYEVNDHLTFVRPPGYLIKHWEGWYYRGFGDDGEIIGTGRHPYDTYDAMVRQRYSEVEDYDGDDEPWFDPLPYLDAYLEYKTPAEKYPGDNTTLQ